MMQQIRVYYSPMNKNYFTDEVSLYCSRCRQRIEKLMLHCYEWNKKNVIESFYCKHCFYKIKPLGTVVEIKIVLMVQFPPEDACPVVFRPPVLKDGLLSTFEAVSQQSAPADQVIDNTVLSGREGSSWVGLKIGSPNMKQITKKDKPLSKKEGIKLLKGVIK